MRHRSGRRNRPQVEQRNGQEGQKVPSRWRHNLTPAGTSTASDPARPLNLKRTMMCYENRTTPKATDSWRYCTPILRTCEGNFVRLPAAHGGIEGPVTHALLLFPCRRLLK